MILRLIAFYSLAVPAMAGEFSLSLPIDCDLDNDCHIQQFVDHDPSRDAADFNCQGLSYDGHKGTDFALPSLNRMAVGVDVLASASGAVKGVRNDMVDVGFSKKTADYVRGRECGNGVVIDHGNGWETQYCHMKINSVRVSPGDMVAVGDVLGQVGLSGRAQFPHVHLSVRKNGVIIDPFDPEGVGCDATEVNTLWQDDPVYRPGGLIAVGISGAIPPYEDVKAGTVAAFDATSAALVIWAYGFGFREGDILQMGINGPNNLVISQNVTMKKAQAQAFRAVGKKAHGGWQIGDYIGTVSMVRGGDVVSIVDVKIELP